MSEEINKFDPSNPDIPKLREYSDLIATEDKVKVGALFFDSRAERILIVDEIIERDEHKYISLWEYNPNTKQKDRYWESPSLESFIKKYAEAYIPNYEEYSKQAEDYLFNGKEFQIEEEETEQSTALVHSTNKHMLSAIHGQIELKRKKMDLLKSMVNIKLIEQNNKLQAIKKKMEAQVAIFQKEMNKIMKVIGMIELYLGIEEELFQLQAGESAALETQISLRQLVLYADEELGNCDDGGIDYSQLDKFDNWLLEKQNYKIMIPEERGIVAIKPRRYDKEYGDRYENAVRNRWNKETYFLIRNGENLYRICSPHISVGKTMFPLRKEFESILNQEGKFAEKKFDDLTDTYMKISLFIQGLIDRTEVFAPLREGVKINEIEVDGGINLIYDAEMLLPSGRLSFADWRKEINSNVGRGSRIILSPDHSCKWYSGYYNTGEGFFKYYSDDYSMPDKPSNGLYIVEEVVAEKDKKESCIRYMPTSETYSWTFGASERKNRVTWVIDLEKSWYLNYDRISLEDIDFYLNSRLERANYLSVLPLLREIKKHLIEETKKEDQFKLMLEGMAIRKGIVISDYFKQEIQEAIDWFKYKNIWKRPITQDDAKATRMIQAKLFNIND